MKGNGLRHQALQKELQSLGPAITDILGIQLDKHPGSFQSLMVNDVSHQSGLEFR
jgi:hypothetical protein